MRPPTSLRKCTIPGETCRWRSASARWRSWSSTLSLNVLYLYVLPVDQLAAVKGSVLDVIADKLLGTRAGDVMGLVSIVSLAASVSAMTFAGPRVYYAMARDGLFFPAAAQVHPRYRTPAVAILAQAVWSGFLVLSGGASALTRYTGFAVVLFAGVAVAALFVLRWREPDAPRPFQRAGLPDCARPSSRWPAASSSSTRSTATLDRRAPAR